MFLGTVTDEDIKRVKNPNQTTHISLFTGCGGLDIGFSDAGWQTRVMIERDKTACETLRINWTMEGHRRAIEARMSDIRKNWRGGKKRGMTTLPMTEEERDRTLADLEKWKNSVPGRWYHKPEPVIMERDITTVSVEEVLAAAKLKVGECGIVTGGFPCQGFSTAGPRMLDDPRNMLYKECVRMVRGVLPRTFLFENVQGLISMDNGRIIDQICTDLAESGYQVSWQKMDAADYGVPQHRVRVFFIGQRNDAMVMPEQGNMQYHMGCMIGPVKHPDFYVEKFGIQNKYAEQLQQSLF